MWKRVHLATIDGPDPGNTIELGAAGRGVAPSGPVTVGRSEFADHQILDPRLSRHHFQAYSGTNRVGRPGAWIMIHGTQRHVAIGRRFRAGGTTFEVRTDGTPRRFPLRSLARFLPLAAAFGFVAMWLVPGAGPWPLVLAAVAAPAGMAVANSRASPPLPDPARLHRAMGAQSGSVPAREPPFDGTGSSWRVETGNLRRRRSFEITAGQTLGLAGEGAAGMGRWVAAQLLAAGGQVRTTQEEGLTRFMLEFSGGKEVHVICAPSPALLPAHVSHILPAPAGHNRLVSQRWFSALSSQAEGGSLPQVAPLTGHLPPLETVEQTWLESDGGLAVPVGLTLVNGELTAFEIDLGQTPHAVVAGTTGAGKSELLTSWLCQVAVRYPPLKVAMVLIDYKGGATFGSLAAMPHVLDVLTDLDHPATVRALESLRVEIHRRERILQDSASTNLLEHNRRGAQPLGRLLIVVDEFRVLAEEHPPLLEQLVRVAAQGRSLGIHVVLATQRPGGAVTPDIRANMGIRACLRVVEESDSVDLIDSAAAAHLPAVPGRMIVQVEERHPVQTFWAGGQVDQIVRACVHAAASAPHLSVTHRPWADPLPEVVPLPPPAAPGHICLGLADLPAEQRLAPWQLPLEGRYLIAGDAGSGRSSTLRVLAGGVLATGRAVHTISSTALLPEGSGSWVRPEDPPACVALLEALSHPGADALMVDDLEALVEALEHALGPGEGPTHLHRMFRLLRRHQRFLAVSCAVPVPSWVEGFEQIIFPPQDTHKRLLAGVSEQTSGPPGRALAVRGGNETLIQIAREHPPPTGMSVKPEVLIRPLPTRVELPIDAESAGEVQVANAGPPSVVIGVGGNDSHPVVLPTRAGQVTAVIGPHGSGKSNLLAVIGAQAGHLESSVVVADDAHRLEPSALDALQERVAAGTHLVVATTPEGRTSVYHPLITRLRHAEQTILLGEMSKADVGVHLGRYLAPGVRGRAVLARGGTWLPVQIFAAPQQAQSHRKV